MHGCVAAESYSAYDCGNVTDISRSSDFLLSSQSALLCPPEEPISIKYDFEPLRCLRHSVP
jgi:hypothetical protein